MELTKEQFEYIWFGGLWNTCDLYQNGKIVKLYNDLFLNDEKEEDKLCTTCEKDIIMAKNKIRPLRDEAERKWKT